MLGDEALLAAPVVEVLLGEMVEPIAQPVVDDGRRFEADRVAGVLGAEAEVGVVVAAGEALVEAADRRPDRPAEPDVRADGVATVRDARELGGLVLALMPDERIVEALGVERAPHDVEAVERADHRAEPVRRDLVVGVAQHDLVGGAGADTEVSGAVQAGTRLVEDLEVRQLRGEPPDQLRGGVGGAVVDEDELPVGRILLVAERVELALDRPLTVADTEHHARARWLHRCDPYLAPIRMTRCPNVVRRRVARVVHACQ